MIRRRRTATSALAVVICTLAMLAGAPNASALSAPICGPTGDFQNHCDLGHPVAGPSHVGWVYLNLNYCPPTRFCTAIYHASMPAWSWTGSAWRPATLSQGWVYVYPYTGGWRWAWTQRTGWVAVNSGRFERRYY